MRRNNKRPKTPARHQRLTSVSLATWEAGIRRLAVPGQLISKITRAKQTRVVNRVVEHLLCKSKLSSNSAPPEKKKIGYKF
jgi:hypothetical protein